MRVVDFRLPSLRMRIEEEKERLAEMQAELTELAELGLKVRPSERWDDYPVEDVIFNRQKPDGWFRLPDRKSVV